MVDKPTINKTPYWDDCVYSIQKKRGMYYLEYIAPHSCCLVKKERVSELPNDIYQELGVESDAPLVHLSPSEIQEELSSRVYENDYYSAELKKYKLQTYPIELISLSFYELSRNYTYFYYGEQIAIHRFRINWNLEDYSDATTEIMMFGEDGLPSGEYITVPIKEGFTVKPREVYEPIYDNSNYDLYWHGDTMLNSRNAGIYMFDGEMSSYISWNQEADETDSYIKVLESIKSHSELLAKHFKENGKVKWRKIR